MKKVQTGARWLGLAGAILASGCSPYLYRDEIQAFDQNTRALAVALDDAETAAAIDYRRRLGFHHLVKDPPPRIALAKDCVDRAERAKSVTETVVESGGFVCRIAAVDPATGAETPLDTDPFREPFANSQAILNALDAYTKALLAITDAGDRKALDAAAGNFCGAVKTLAAAAPAPGAGAAAGAVCAAVATAAAAYRDHRRYAVLRAGVVAADRDVMPGLTEYLAVLLQQARNDRIASVAFVADAASRSLGAGAQASQTRDTDDLVYTERYWAPWNRIFASAADLEMLLTLDPAAVVASLRTAHANLAAAIDSGEAQTKAVAQSLEALGRQIQALRRAFTPAAG